MIDSKLVRPAEEARQQLKPLKRTIKHRENMKLDYERYAGRADHVRKKDTRSAKEEAVLAKHESDLAQAHIDYQAADDQIKESFPAIIGAVNALIPYLLASEIRIQTALVGQLYTVLDQYTRQIGLPNPAPSDNEIINKWNQDFTNFRKELEGLSF
jgi:amphiphysin